MAGAGVAVGGSALEALRLNPALLATGNGQEVEGAVANQSDDGSIASRVGPFSGRTNDAGRDSLLPAFAWSGHAAKRVAWGFGAFTAGSFGVDVGQDSTNPILAPQPSGFGRVHSRYEVFHVPFAVAFEVTPAFSFGVAARLGQATFGANPATFAAPDCSGPAGPCFFPVADDEKDTAMGFQVGALYTIGQRFALGASYSIAERYELEWHSAVANPSLPTFGRNRTFEQTMEEPAVATVGIAFQPTPRWTLALDGQQIAYDGTEGFGDAFGFQDVTVVVLGIELQATDKLSLRLGASRADSPIQDERAFAAIAAPVLVKERFAAGLGWVFARGLTLDLAFVHGGKEAISGPFLGPSGAVPNTSVTLERLADTISVGFRFRPQR